MQCPFNGNQGLHQQHRLMTPSSIYAFYICWIYLKMVYMIFDPIIFYILFGLPEDPLQHYIFV